jgi:hypothetical protein
VLFPGWMSSGGKVAWPRGTTPVVDAPRRSCRPLFIIARLLRSLGLIMFVSRMAIGCGQLHRFGVFNLGDLPNAGLICPRFCPRTLDRVAQILRRLAFNSDHMPGLVPLFLLTLELSNGDLRFLFELVSRLIPRKAQPMSIRHSNFSRLN